MSILAISTIGHGSSIAIVDYDGNCFVEHNSASNNHAESFFQILDTLFSKHNYNYDKIDHLAVVVGPGSFTGIRVVIAAAKGISLATNKPLYGVSALEVQAYAMSLLCEDNRGNIRATVENATQLFDCNLLPLSEPEVIDKGITQTLNAGHAGLLVRHRLMHKQELSKAKALYLNEPEYIRSP
ncbi:tRNA (adenosine(37)-N6)-threonylcarbamoyltransferase complex dimerization subunit type 1 TsaB [Wolbachia endosymbiont of Ctenocephalides felis wCfeT]|uniref:tRNA (adenosine(37)-N6)-threonylcarbamoyltransferase complex dimerization subunit type 1 TsaB n=1 Tax=Wolbachia endosymbiont of Ctenocephalides felis wCfeT TaxID=2732593 RepID=UPI0014461865|nr:tRNA (adenosine(37)-N6)-threonylcarbamoyltransferase complex dimerization subunit type 1 TsaB [Wolbachia endosymbiont of Ctenocephalides felis wCfeT]